MPAILSGLLVVVVIVIVVVIIIVVVAVIVVVIVVAVIVVVVAVILIQIFHFTQYITLIKILNSLQVNIILLNKMLHYTDNRIMRL